MYTKSMVRKQTGAALFTALIFLLVLTLIGVTALKDSGLSERMSANAQISQMAFNAAESAMDQYIAEYNSNVNAVATTETEVDDKVLRLSAYLPTQTADDSLEYCINNQSKENANNSILAQLVVDITADPLVQKPATAGPLSIDCGNTTIDGSVQAAVSARNRVSYQGCPGSCPRYSLGLGKQKVSCHVFLMEAEGKVDQTTAVIDQWVSLQGPC